MYICMYVCMYVYIYIYIHTHTYIRTYIHIHTAKTTLTNQILVFIKKLKAYDTEVNDEWE